MAHDWLSKVRHEASLVTEAIMAFGEQDVREAVQGVSEFVASQWARGRPLPRTLDELPVAMIADRYCPGEEGLVRWVAGVLFRHGEMPIVGRLDSPDEETLAKWRDMFDWTATRAAG